MTYQAQTDGVSGRGRETEVIAKVVPCIHNITDRIAITNSPTANNPEALRRAGFSPEAILCLDAHSQARYGTDGRTVVKLVDGANDTVVFARAATTLETLLQKHGRVLVHCHAGRSRSIAVVAAHLCTTMGLSVAAALALVSARRPCASVMPGLIANLHTFHSH